jgi:hypothetical protein
MLAAMRSRRTAAAAVTVAILAAAGGAAVAATKDDPESAILDDAAKRLNVTPKALKDALAAAEDAQLDRAVRAGRLTREEADRLKQERARSGSVLGVPGPGWHGGPRHGGPGPGHFGADEAGAAARALGLSTDALLDRLRDGDSLADVAKAQNKDLADVKAAVRAALAADLDEAVQDHRLTRERADELLKAFDERFDDLARRSGPMRPGRGPGFGGPGFGFGGLRFDLRQEAAAAAKALGIPRAQLLDRLRDGERLADIAEDENTPLADVRAAVRAAFKDGLDAAVEAGKITQARADEVLEAFDERFDELARGQGHGVGHRGPRHRGP